MEGLGKSWLTAPDRFHGGTAEYQLLRCPSCSLGWIQDPPSPKCMLDHYTAEYHTAVAKAGAGQARWKQHRETLYRFKQAGSVLDLGCSAGSFLAALDPAAWQRSGIEMSEVLADRAREVTQGNIFSGDIMSASFAPGTFDVVTCFDVLEHLYDPRAAVERVWQWLKPGGIFYLFVPNIECWEARIFGSYWFGLELPRHLYHFSPRSLRFLMNSCGLDELSCIMPSVNYLGYDARYVWETAFARLGLKFPPLAAGSSPAFLWRMVRKAFRVTLGEAFGRMASFAGAGPAITAVYRKPACGR